VLRSWEATWPGNEPKLAIGNTPHHGHHAKFINTGRGGGAGIFSCLSSDTLFSGSSNFFQPWEGWE